MQGAVDAVLGLVGDGGRHLVVTPNVDHLVLLEDEPEFAAAYARASVRVADGAPLVALARLCGTPLPARVPGIDLALATLAGAAERGQTVYFFGGAPATLERALTVLRGRLPSLRVLGHATPPVDLERIGPEESTALDEVRAAQPDLLFLFLGTPKQEVWFFRRADRLPPTVAMAVGGAIDMIAGTRRRAPHWVQSIGLEWLWRLAQEPRRLAHRYLVRDRRFLGIAWRQVRDERSARRG
jgi:N-acetylglucosaminyldiphosphoundecaprenol N-acetyl-beta-D-mannosaminyltransferase